MLYSKSWGELWELEIYYFSVRLQIFIAVILYIIFEITYVCRAAFGRGLVKRVCGFVQFVLNY